ncbi:MAG: hypothetical protein LBN06_07960 [Prevotellaceae bacterium]|jgi:hypothetical protein|nr:hypothetical protein [Prevotellaceae bacterium]
MAAISLTHIKRLLLGEAGSASTGSSGKLTNRRLVKMIQRAFEQEIARRSMKETMFFPLCIYIDLHSGDFLDMRPFFPHIVMELKRSLPQLVARKQRHYAYSEPASAFWHFEFRTVDHITTLRTGEEPVPGAPSIQMLPVGPRRQGEGVTTGVNDAGKTSQGKGSSPISHELIVESGMWDDGRTFTPPYTPSVGRSPSTAATAPSATAAKHVLAVLQEGDHRFEMQETKMEICGSTDTRKLPKSVWRLSAALPVDPYICIEYKERDKCFVFVAFGDLTLNGSSIKAGKSADLKRYKLESGSVMVIPAAERPLRISFQSSVK